jgi:arylsulfatase A-like enzyme
MSLTFLLHKANPVANASMMLIEAFLQGEKGALPVAICATLALAAKSILDFSRSGPDIRAEVLSHYRIYSLFAFIRLCTYAFLILFVMASTGVLMTVQLCQVTGLLCGESVAIFASVSAIALLTAMRFCWQLLYLPANLVASSHYRLSRLYPLWRQLSPLRLHVAGWCMLLLVAGLGANSMLVAVKLHAWPDLTLLSVFTLLIVVWIRWGQCARYPSPVVSRQRTGQPNILMIGSDTLRADRIRPDLTPNICKLAEHSVHFTHCYVPCARTAPSLASLLTGVWPHRHGIRDNFVAHADTQIPVTSLPEMLAAKGYITSAISDWCGSDMGKFSFHFNRLDIAPDQWNLKYLIRQGPKDIRLFLSLFTHNSLGKKLLPELYYLGGVPLTDQLGLATCSELNHLAKEERPFFLNTFFSTTHPPFGSEYPYYTLFSTPEYSGESKFAMARLTDPWEVIRRQAEPREAFDLDQIIHLYDGCVRRFDDEVGRILQHLDDCKLADNTIVVVYSDHGMEFFEHGTWGQGNSAVGDHSARIPLLIGDPRHHLAGEVGDVVRSIDLAPTLLELLDIKPASDMDGASLADYIKNPTHSSQRDAFYETGIWLTKMPGMAQGHMTYPNIMEMLEVPDKAAGTLAIKQEYAASIIAAKDRMIRSGRWKLVYQPLENGCNLLLFDVETDPECTQNHFQSRPDIAAALWRNLQNWMACDQKLQQPLPCPMPAGSIVIQGLEPTV